MEALKKLVAVYLVGLAVAVAVYFIIGGFIPDDFDSLSVWEILDILMVIGLGFALLFNYDRKRREGGRDSGEPVTRRYLEVNLLFYFTAGITILFLHNWFALLGFGADNLGAPDVSGQPPEVGNLGSSGRVAADNPGRDGLPHVGRLFF